MLLAEKKIPADALIKIIGMVMNKRSKLFSTVEQEFIPRCMKQFGSFI